MLFDDVKRAVDRFSLDELRRLHEYIENMKSLMAALEDIRAGLSEAEFAEIEQAMNEAQSRYRVIRRFSFRYRMRRWSN